MVGPKMRVSKKTVKKIGSKKRMGEKKVTKKRKKCKKQKEILKKKKIPRQTQEMADVLKLKNEISKSAENIRKKYQALKRGKETDESRLMQTWSPLTNPIQQNIIRVADSIDEIVRHKKNKKKLQEFNVGSDKELALAIAETPKKPPAKQRAIRQSVANRETPTPQVDNREEEKGGEEEEEENFVSPAVSKEAADEAISIESQRFSAKKLAGLNPDLRHFISKIAKGQTEDMDDLYGVKYTGKSWTIGGSQVSFDKYDVFVDNKKFEGSRGLYELLFSKMPDEDYITKDDMANYKQILEISNAHRKTYSADKAVMGNKGFKYTAIISKLFPPKSKKLGSGSDVTMNARQPVCHYYDDVNDLVDRLRLLTASSSAGNNAHQNEVNAILAELREAQLVE